MLDKCANPGCFGASRADSIYCNYHHTVSANPNELKVSDVATSPTLDRIPDSGTVTIRLDADRLMVNGKVVEPPESPIVSRVGRRHTDRPPESIPMSEKYPKYYKRIPDGLKELDIYAVCQMFPVDDATGCINHARKKLLIPGTRTGGKSMYKDVKEARDTLNRWLELNTPSTDSD